MRTKERLAQALASEGLHFLAGQASAGRYDDFESESSTPCHDLVNALRAAGREDLAQRAMNGEWDGSPEEADEWFQREGKDLLTKP